MSRSALRMIADIVEKEATPEECQTIHIDTNRRTHPRLTIEVNNTLLRLTCPGSPSDGRWAKNWRADFRRQYRQAKGEV